MEEHLFKAINSTEDGVYRIIDLTDTLIVGITDCLETDDEIDRKYSIQQNKDIKSKKELGAKVTGYNIFLYLDSDNVSSPYNENKEYVRSVLKQMAEFFKKEVIDKNSDDFEPYRVPSYKRGGVSTKANGNHLSTKTLSTVTQTEIKKTKKGGWENRGKWLRGWRLWLVIGIVAAIIISIILFPVIWEVILGLPMLIIMFLAYFDDIVKRKGF